MGGFLAVSWTDTVQATLMIFALLLTPIIVLLATDGDFNVGVSDFNSLKQMAVAIGSMFNSKKQNACHCRRMSTFATLRQGPRIALGPDSSKASSNTSHMEPRNIKYACLGNPCSSRRVQFTRTFWVGIYQ